MFAGWNSVHLFLYNGLSRNAQRRVFVDCAALHFIISFQFNTPTKIPYMCKSSIGIEGVVLKYPENIIFSEL